MARVNTIALDVTRAAAPAQWSPAWVQHRVVEAFAIERRLPAKRGARITGAWPAINYEFADVVGWDNARERVLENWARSRDPVFAGEMARMEQAHEWLRVILARHEIERACLAQWAAAIAYRRSLRDLLARKRWARTTFYRYVGAGAFIIAQRLDHDGVVVT